MPDKLGFIVEDALKKGAKFLHIEPDYAKAGPGKNVIMATESEIEVLLAEHRHYFGTKLETEKHGARLAARTA